MNKIELSHCGIGNHFLIVLDSIVDSANNTDMADCVSPANAAELCQWRFGCIQNIVLDLFKKKWVPHKTDRLQK